MKLQTLPPDCSVDEIVAAIGRDGGCIVRDVLSEDALAALDGDVTRLIEQTEAGTDEWAGTQTKRTGGLVARAPSSRPVVTHPLVLAAANTMLGGFCERIQLNLTQLISILPGQGGQPLHRDRFVWGGGGTSFDGAGAVPREVEPQFNTIWALTDFTEENGATVVAPGSQRWEFGGTAPEREPRPEELTQAVMSRGSALLYTGSVIHAGGQNRSDSARIGMNITYSLGWLRQEENQYLSCPPEVAKELEDPALTDLLGYTMGNFALGFCTSPDPADSPRSTTPERMLGRLVSP
ncbi:phytanoyl-CoA dioxygenase family protein [Tomitella gaofuii]|uniref:phytanoyl-CoA dioxygenase family protein n=1 Tax=Tomitella gaofuii TaxID=2760083 RepID=UPI0015FA87B8|nr:phytanoyl-CoA dioxygenase family protein [Tomitella gaofuii]